ncbi:MAG: amidohydrolase family protein [Chloroflexi bacterium]|nr:amidohydrolase family protein [Chloroflexota bacterium]
MTTFLRVGKLLDGTGAAALGQTEIQIEGQRFVALGTRPTPPRQGDLVWEFPDGVAVPGFIDLHTHFCYPLSGDFQKAQLHYNRIEMMDLGFRRARSWLEQGVTTARVLGTHFDLDLGLRDLIEEQPELGPRLLCAGRMMTMTGGRRTPWDVMKDEVTGADEARRWARGHLQEGADLIKLYCTTLLEEDVADYLRRSLALPEGAPDPGRWASLSVEEIRATVDEAHKVGATVAAHVSPAFGVKLALQGGVDTVDHGTDMDEACIDLFLQTGATLVPTLSVSKPEVMEAAERDSVYGQHARRRWAYHARIVNKAFQAGVPIGTGTDNVLEGMAYALEIELLVEVGLPPMEALRCATQRAAACLGPRGQDMGTIEPGKYADVVILRGDPLADIRHVRQVAAVFKGGHLVAQPAPQVGGEVAHG